MAEDEARESLADLLKSNLNIASGCVVFKDTRIPVDVLFVNSAAGSSLDDIVDDFPSIGQDRAAAIIRLAGQSVVARVAK